MDGAEKAADFGLGRLEHGVIVVETVRRIGRCNLYPKVP